MTQEPEKPVLTTGYIDDAIAAWVIEKQGISESWETEKKYHGTITDFRAWLRSAGYPDLDLELWVDPGARQDPQAWRRASTTLAAQTQLFMAASKRGKKIAAATKRQRLSIIRSFYDFAIGTYFTEYVNPTSKVKAPKVPLYGRVGPLNTEVVRQAIQAIDTSTLKGLHDLALLTALFGTGRRLHEVQSLCWRNVELMTPLSELRDASEVQIALNFERIKGGGTAHHELSIIESRCILTWVTTYYQMITLHLDGDRPLWVSFSTMSRGRQLTDSGIRFICDRRLNTTRVHRTRHTFAHVCLEAGMKLTDLQGLLTHSNLATTGIYAGFLMSGKNNFSSHLDDALGFGG